MPAYYLGCEDDDYDPAQFNALVRAQIVAALAEGSNVTLTPSGVGAGVVITISSSGSGNVFDPAFNAAVRAQLEAALTPGANVTLTPAGAGDTRTVGVASATAFDAVFNAAVRAQVSSMLAQGANVTLTPAGAGAALTVTVAAANGATIGYEHVQSVAATSWLINHNLGYKPGVDVLDAADNKISAEVRHTSLNQLTITLNLPTIGKAILR
jgi:hypothetical protein